jgi:cation diffusion facilitator CzcD-associated flavoprotein CzcO
MVDPNANRVDIGIPVLIVGAGPAGLTLALALTRYGVPALTIERHPGTAHTPRAHIINQRTVEIFRALVNNARNHDSPIRQSRIDCEPAFSHRHQGPRPGATRSHTHGKMVVRPPRQATWKCATAAPDSNRTLRRRCPPAELDLGDAPLPRGSSFLSLRDVYV